MKRAMWAMPAGVLTVAWKSLRVAELSGNLILMHAPPVVGVMAGEPTHGKTPGKQDAVTSGQGPEDISLSAASFKPKSADFRLLWLGFGLGLG